MCFAAGADLLIRFMMSCVGCSEWDRPPSDTTPKMSIPLQISYRNTSIVPPKVENLTVHVSTAVLWTSSSNRLHPTSLLDYCKMFSHRSARSGWFSTYRAPCALIHIPSKAAHDVNSVSRLYSASWIFHIHGLVHNWRQISPSL